MIAPGSRGTLASSRNPRGDTAESSVSGDPVYPNARATVDSSSSSAWLSLSSSASASSTVRDRFAVGSGT